MNDRNDMDKGLLTKTDRASATVTYVGQAPVGTEDGALAWKIKRISISGNITSVQWAGGSLDFSNRWSDRASYIYS